MRTSARIAPLVLLAGLAGGTAQSGPVPPAPIAEAQLRAINHRFVDSFVSKNGAFLDSLTSEDFVQTAADGSWRERGEFLQWVHGAAPLSGASSEDVRVRLFGPVALLHAVFEGVAADGHVARARYTDVYFWDGADWRLVSGQITPLKEGVPVQLQTEPVPAHGRWQGDDPSGGELDVLRSLNESYVRAFREADVAWYDAHLAPDYVVISSDGSFHDRAGALANFARPTFATHMKSFPVDKVRVRRFGEVALIHAENAYELKDGRRGVSRYTDIWLRRDGAWRCIAAHITAHQLPTAS